MWRSLVAHLLWEQGVGSSNLPIPTREGILLAVGTAWEPTGSQAWLPSRQIAAAAGLDQAAESTLAAASRLESVHGRRFAIAQPGRAPSHAEDRLDGPQRREARDTRSSDCTLGRQGSGGRRHLRGGVPAQLREHRTTPRHRPDHRSVHVLPECDRDGDGGQQDQGSAGSGTGARTPPREGLVARLPTGSGRAAGGGPGETMPPLANSRSTSAISRLCQSTAAVAIGDGASGDLGSMAMIGRP